MLNKPTLQQIAEYYGVTDRTLRNWREKDPKLYRAAILGYNAPDDCTPESCAAKSAKELIEMKRWHTDAIRRSLEQIERIDRRLSEVTGVVEVDIIDEIRQIVLSADGALCWCDGSGRYLDDGELQHLLESGAFDDARVVPLDIDLMRRAADDASVVLESVCLDCVQVAFPDGVIWI